MLFACHVEILTSPHVHMSTCKFLKIAEQYFRSMSNTDEFLEIVTIHITIETLEHCTIELLSPKLLTSVKATN